MVKTWFVYVVKCSDGSLYTGITTNLSRRIRTHNAGKGGVYTRARRPVECIFEEAHPSRSFALKREYKIKGWSHAEKESLKWQTKQPPVRKRRNHV